MHGSFIQQTSHRFDALSAHREQTLYCWHWTTMYGIYTKSTRPVVHTTKSSIINQVQMGFATFSNSICIIRRVLFLLLFLVSLIIFWWIYLKNTFLQVWSWVNIYILVWFSYCIGRSATFIGNLQHQICPKLEDEISCF